MRWYPANIEEICPEQRIPLTQCSRTGFMYLALISQLFGGSKDFLENQYGTQYYVKPSVFNFPEEISGPNVVIPGSLRLPDSGNSVSGAISSFGVSGPSTNSIRHSEEQSFSGPEYDDFKSDLFNFKTKSPFSTASTGGFNSYSKFTPKPYHDEETIEAHSHGEGGSHGISKTTFYRKKLFDSPEIKFDFESESFGSNHFSKHQRLSHGHPRFDFSFPSKDSFFDDIDGAFSKTDNVKVAAPENSKKSPKSRTKRNAREEYDFIIVGAGSAGCVLANRLSEVKDWRILLLEAGPEEPDITGVPAFAPSLGQSSIDWMYRTQPEDRTCLGQRGQTCPWFRGRTMGGSSAINYMVYIRGNRKDYDEWAALGNEGWSYRDVLPYFKKSENNQDLEGHDKYYHSTNGPLNVERYSYVDQTTMLIVQGFKERGLPITDLNGRNQIGTGIVQSTTKNGIRMSTNAAFIRPIREHRPNLIIKTEAQVTKIIIDPLTKVAQGVAFVRNGQYYTAFARKEVIVSAGAINSPKILMLSGIGPKYHLDSLNIDVIQDLKVGYNLQDHVTTDALIITLSNKTSTLTSGDQVLAEVYNYHKQHPTKKNGPLSTTSVLNSVAFYKTDFSEDPEAPDIQYHFDGRNVQEFYADPVTYMATNVLPLPFYDGLAARPLLLTPRSRGVIMLNLTDPVFGPPLIYSGFFTVKEDMDALVAAARFVVSLENTSAFRLNGASFTRVPMEACARHKWGTYEYFACLYMQYTTTIYHPTSTCKMGPKWDKDAVVDPKLKVYGIHNLRVIDASIMPKIVRGNTNAPVIMIAEKSADIIKEEWL